MFIFHLTYEESSHENRGSVARVRDLNSCEIEADGKKSRPVRQQNIYSVFFLLRQLREWKRPLAAYNAERKASFRAICAAGNREFYAPPGSLYLLQTSAAMLRQTLHSGKQTVYLARGPTIRGELFLQAVARLMLSRTAGTFASHREVINISRVVRWAERVRALLLLPPALPSPPLGLAVFL